MDNITKSLELCIGDNMATQIEIDHFMSFIHKLKSSRRVRFIYRGDSNIIEQYNTDLGNLPLLCRLIFCLGDKGRIFFQDKIIDNNGIFSIIWEIFHNKVCKSKFTHKNTIQQVDKFLKNNPEFNQYFSDTQNKQQFENLSQLSVCNARKVVDYYLSILHSIGKSGNGNSYFLSSSTRIQVADEFKGDNCIILYGWVPRKRSKNNIVNIIDTDKCCNFVKSLGLPTHQVPVYPEQKEICIKCGLLPHFIIGFQHKTKFYINPNTLKQWRNSIVYEGLDIDPQEFHDLFNATKLKQSFIFCGGCYYLISNKGINEI